MTAKEFPDTEAKPRIFLGTKTTRTVCLPTCPVKKAGSRHLIVFDSMEEALAQGYRPCLRCRPDQPEWEGAKKELAKAAARLIDKHYKEPFSLKALAGELYINESYLARTFKQETGQTLLWYHNHVRCRKAAELLEKADVPISFISSETGFCSSSHFTRIFRNYYGCTPSEYRRKKQ
ncbi:MAG: helix-turn-helix domain-containing protein [Blautia sp.]|nr:helix-turn-helix domain-containing protein [Blautia sp.]